MLGWMLKRGEDMPDNADAGDTTIADGPNTPAPVFVARAFKSALFGTPRDDVRAKRTSAPAIMNHQSQTPNAKPQGILLTPGTGTSRQKRVSFGRDVRNVSGGSRDEEQPKRTKLNEALEKARQQKYAVASRQIPQNQVQKDPPVGEWGEVDDAVEDVDNCSHDITLDLNDPHSESGKYWKKEFEKYHDDAKAELEKLLKYKQLAKLYAQQKDAQAIELAERLKEEQQKVIKMERNIAENASDIITRCDSESQEASPEMVARLSKQTALAVQYRQRVQDLEAQLEAFLEQKQGSADPAPPSPTQTETQRELRQARSQLKEMDILREQVSALKAQLKVSEKRAAKAEVGIHPDSLTAGQTKELKAQLREAKERSRQKDEEMLQLKRQFEEFRRESQAHDEETNQVLERAHTKITDLRKEIKALKSAPPQSHHAKDSGEQVDPALRHGNTSRPARHSGATSNNREQDTAAVHAQRNETRDPEDKYRSLRDKFNDDATNMSAVPGPGQTDVMSGALGDVPRREKHTRQTSDPRSPKNPAYPLEEKWNRSPTRSPIRPVSSATAKKQQTDDHALPGLGETLARSGQRPDKDRGADLHRTNRAAALGHHEGNNGVVGANASKSKLPPERRAAAMARIERRRAEKLRQRAGNGIDKENVLP